ncbi:MAG: hypothetical protein IIB62_02065, partial [Proteobacteria bacterium]|nr:hypothetical protein [Pseudomonadota bacterium]
FIQNFPNLLQLNLPILLIGNINAAPGIVAAFVMSRTIINFVRQILQHFAFVLSQEISRAFARGENKRVRDLFVATNRLVCAITGATLGCLLALAQQFFVIWSSGTVDYNENLIMIFAFTTGLAAPATVSASLPFNSRKSDS